MINNFKNLLIECKKDNIWIICNQTLYELCKKYPYHNNDKEIIAKILLIGRSYAASIERRKNKDNFINDDFYFKKVIPIIKNSIIDELLKKVNKKELDSILKIHNYLTNIFKKISGLNKRSLASKYLHFHKPEIFYLYDSRAISSLGKLFKYFKIKKQDCPKKINKYDKTYSNYYIRSQYIVDYIEKEFKISLKCKEFDDLLMEIGNKKLRKKIAH